MLSLAAREDFACSLATRSVTAAPKDSAEAAAARARPEEPRRAEPGGTEDRDAVERAGGDEAAAGTGGIERGSWERGDLAVCAVSMASAIVEREREPTPSRDEPTDLTIVKVGKVMKQNGTKHVEASQP